MRLDHGVIAGPPDEGARAVAQSLLAATDEAAARLSAATDPEALHDFRVALRRLRSLLRAFRPWIGGDVGRRNEKRLKRCARDTNEARDAEVHLEWLQANSASLIGRHRRGARALSEFLEARAKEAAPVGRVLRRYGRASVKLARRLARVPDAADGPERETGTAPTFGAVLATLATQQLAVVQRRIGAVESALDHEAIHRARIDLKRLRYLLEPLREHEQADAREAVQLMRQLQDVLGELHDTHVLAEAVLDVLSVVARERVAKVHRAAYERGASDRSARGSSRDGRRAGLVAIDRMLGERRDALYSDLEREWRSAGLEALSRAVQAVVEGLRATIEPRGTAGPA